MKFYWNLGFGTWKLNQILMPKTITPRQIQILNFIIDKYVKDGEPVGSMELVRYAGLDLSSATVRNEMAILEEAGLISQPHTSAGRIPTTAGFKFYLNHKNFEHQDQPVVSEPVEKVINVSEDSEHLGRDLAKWLAQESNDFAVVSFGDNQIFYAGFSNLANKNELRDDFDLFREFSSIVDEMDLCFDWVMSRMHGRPEVFLGTDNPWSAEMSLVATDIPLGTNNAIIGLLGPLRMNYAENLALLNYVKNKMGLWTSKQ